MKTKMIFSLVVGFGIGVACSYKHFKDKFEQQAKEDIAKSKEYYDEELKKFVNDISEGDVEENVEVEIKIDKTVDYNSIVEAYSAPEEEKPKKKGGRKKKQKEPSALIISSDEFIDLNGYDKKTLYFFTEDRVFTDVDYEVFEEGMSVIGEENLDAYTDSDALYVRNDAFGTDYEIIFKYELFSEFMEEN